MTLALFFFSILLIFYAYFGYPLSLYLIMAIKGKRVMKSGYMPSVTLIITAYNEEKRIENKLKNTVELDYPREKLQVLVASDGSTDRTNEIVSNFTDHGIELLEIKQRNGKENAQKLAVGIATGEILVFSDVATHLEPKGLREIVGNFNDPSVGCVSSEDVMMTKDGKKGGEGLYVRYEMWMRRLESRANSLIGLSGSFFAARKEVCQDFVGNMQSDFRTVMSSIRLGLRAVSDPDAIGIYYDIKDEKKEFDRKVRTVLRGLTVFFKHIEFLNPRKFGMFSYQLFCHKLLRWMVPFFMLTALVSNAVLAMTSFLYSMIFMLHVAAYAAATVTIYKNKANKHVLLKILVYFLTVNSAIMVAWVRFFVGQRIVMWNPSDR